MGKHLKLGSDPGGQNWALPDHTNIEKLRAEIAEAMEEEKALRVTVVLGRNQTAELLVNGGEVTAALVYDDASSGGGMTIID
jgi:hypothetical protein